MTLYLGNNMIAGNSAQIDKVAQEIPLGSSKYSGEVLEPSLGWIKSEGQWNSGSVYSTFYTLAADNIGNAFAGGSIVASTDAYTNYDLVVNTNDQTFRLPLLNGQEAMFATGVKGNGNALGLKSVSDAYMLFDGLNNNPVIMRTATGGAIGTSASAVSSSVDVLKRAGLNTDTTKSGIVVDTTTYTIPTGIYLYFKVANAVQNLDMLDAAQVMSAVNTVVPDNSTTIAGYAMPSDTYEDFTIGASGSSYIAPANGYFTAYMISTNTNNELGLQVFDSNGQLIVASVGRNPLNGVNCFAFVPIRKGQSLTLWYQGSMTYLRFTYAKGSESEAS